MEVREGDAWAHESSVIICKDSDSVYSKEGSWGGVEEQSIVGEKAMKMKSQHIGRNYKETPKLPRAAVEGDRESGAEP